MEHNEEERLLAQPPEESNNLKQRVWTEWKMMSKIAFPAMVGRVTKFGMLVVTQSFMGQINELDLAAYALVQIVGVRFVNGLLLGMSSATETLCGQAFGAGQGHMMGIYLQRSWLVDLVIATILVPVFIFASPIFRLLGEAEDVSGVAGEISLWFIPILYYYVFSMTFQMYLQAQLKNMIVGYVNAASFGLHILLSWAFVDKLGLGIPGAMGALIVSSWISVLSQFVYVFGGWCPNTWKGFTVAALTDLFPVIKLSISSGVMLCLELWYNAVLVLLAGYMKNAAVAISAFSICLNISAWELMVCLGFLSAACVRVSNELGKGNANAAKFSIKVILSTAIFVGVFFCIICLVFGRQISYLFTSSEEIADSVSSLSIFLAFSMLLNSIQPVLTGVAIGAGWQSAVAIVNICCYYVIGLPLGIILGYVAHLQIKGIWMGMLCGVAIQMVTLMFIAWRTNWDAEVNKASVRLNKWLVEAAEGSKESSLGTNASSPIRNDHVL